MRQPGFKWRVLAWKLGDRYRNAEKYDVRFAPKDRMKFDELVIDDWFHIEEMNSRHYWMQVCDLHINVVVPSRGKPYISSTWEDK